MEILTKFQQHLFAAPIVAAGKITILK